MEGNPSIHNHEALLKNSNPNLPYKDIFRCTTVNPCSSGKHLYFTRNSSLMRVPVIQLFWSGWPEGGNCDFESQNLSR